MEKPCLGRANAPSVCVPHNTLFSVPKSVSPSQRLSDAEAALQRAYSRSWKTVWAIVLSLLGSFSLAHAVITVGDPVLSPSDGNTKFSYAVNLSTGTITPAGVPSGAAVSRIILYDFAGYVLGSIFAPAGWTMDDSQFAGPVIPGIVDNPLIRNLVFFYTGAPSSTSEQVFLGDFGAVSTSSNTVDPPGENYVTRSRSVGNTSNSSSWGSVLTPGAGPNGGGPVESAILVWDPNLEPDIAGYRLYYGVSSGNYTESIDVGNTTTVAVPNLAVGTTYVFVVTAFNSLGLESLPSNEESFTTGELPAAISAMNRLPDGSIQFTVTRAASLEGTSAAGPVGTAPAMVIQVSTDLTNWNLWVLLENPAATQVLTDADAAFMDRRFYRISTP